MWIGEGAFLGYEMKTEFSSEDLIGKFAFMGPRAQAEYLNSLLPQLKAAWLEELRRDGVRVYFGDAPVKYEHFLSFFCSWQRPEDTHTALLVDIKPIGSGDDLPAL